MKTTTEHPHRVLLIALALLLSGMPLVHAQNGVGINTTSPTSDLEVNGSFAQKVTTVTTSTTLTATHNVVVCNNGATAINITLPAVSGITGRTYTIKRDPASTADVTIVGTIDGKTNHKLIGGGESLTLICDTVDWKIVGGLEYAPMGEISFFSTTGTLTGAFAAATTDGIANMKKCAVLSVFDGQGFDNGGANDGRLRYTGDEMKHFHIACTISIAPSVNNQNLIFAVAKNGVVIPASRVIQRTGQTSDIQSTAIHVAEHMMKGDFLELWAGNMSAASEVRIHSINLFAMGMSHN